MKKRSITTVLFILILIFSSSVATLATESDAWKEKVKATAKADARRDINIGAWYLLGLGTCAACGLGGVLGYQIAYHSYPSSDGYYFERQPPPDKTCMGSECTIPSVLRFIGSFGGASACGSLLGLGASRIRIHPPLERLMGKSSEYVAYYTAAYTQHTMKNRILSTAAGGATVIGCILSVWYLDPYGIGYY